MYLSIFTLAGLDGRCREGKGARMVHGEGEGELD